jgi:hypothetical protein
MPISRDRNRRLVLLMIHTTILVISFLTRPLAEPITVAAERIEPKEPGIQAYDNYDLTGADLRNLTSIDLRACLAACQSDSSCRSFSYDKWKQQCFLKQASGTFRFDASMASGLPQNSATPPTSTESIVMECSQATTFPGDGYSSTTTTSFKECEQTCEKAEPCAAFSYHKDREECKFFRGAEPPRPEQSTDSGFSAS